ncbi:hypothetical protein BB561_005270 [Smittium simulii]|uniref:U three protein 23 n=1 Tax=Smittium simulii TaxID=133385 RepID=A0A2T9YB78_9FUNG|nr:hypothetical protein BB561_005270 [Smittium simulii]
MRVKRAKQYQKNMNVYVNNFKFREPFQVLINSDIIKTSLEAKLPLVEQLTKAVGPVKMLISNCSLQDLRNEDGSMIGAVVLARKFERRRCSHTTPVPGIQCIEEIIGTENINNYCVAVQDQTLRSKLRKIHGIPLFHINRSTLILEPISTSTKDKVKSIEQNKLSISKDEIQRLNSVSMKNEPAEQKNLIFKKFKKPKGPNPLSVKKSKSAKQTSLYNQSGNDAKESTTANNHKNPTLPSVSTLDAEKKKRKRKRSHSKSNNL